MKPRTLVALGALLVVSMSCFSERTSTTEPATGDCSIPATAFGRDHVVVVIRNFTFLSDTVRVRAGGTVTWVNCEEPNVEAHTTTSTTSVWNSGLITPGANFARTFANAGTFPYFCQPHPFMTGVVIVE